MGQKVFPYALAGMAAAMLVGGVVLLGHAVKTWKDERPKDPRNDDLGSRRRETAARPTTKFGVRGT